MKKGIQFLGRLIRWTFLLLFLGGGLLIAYGGFMLFLLNKELPSDLVALHNPNAALPTVLYDRNGNQVEEIFIRRRIIVPFQNFPPHLIQALLASEDTQFFHHFGINPFRMVKAMWTNTKAGRFVEGASTLTQQTAKMFILSAEKEWSRKLKEILLAFRIERQFSKEEILTLYLNKAFLGNAEGVEAAAQGYFGKHVEELSLAESALLVGILPSPARYSPAVNPELATERRALVLRRMHEEGYISEDERKSAGRQPIRLSKLYDSASEATAYYVEHVRQYLLQRYGSEMLYKEGLQVHLAMDLDYQLTAHDALQRGIIEVSKRQGYRGASEHIELNAQGELPQREIHEVTYKNKLILGNVVRGVVTKVAQPTTLVNFGQEEGALEWSHLNKWTIRTPGKEKKNVRPEHPSQMLKVGDVVQVKLIDWDPGSNRFRLVLHQDPLVNGALMSIDPRNGDVLAMSGGYAQSDFNRALDAQRQPGSAFHPIIYASALDAGYTLASMLVDSPQNLAGSSLRGNVPLRFALSESLERPTVTLVEDIGRQRISGYAEKLGIRADAPNSFLTASGTFSSTLKDMTFAYAAFANEGFMTKPIYIARIEDHDGVVLEEHLPELSLVLSKETSFLISDVLREKTNQLNLKGLERPASGYTGTTNNSVDAWHIGFVPQVLTSIYVGFDKSRPMGSQETGAKAASPIWMDYMQGIIGNLPTERFVQPPQVVTVKIHETGRRVGPCDSDETTFDEKFKRGTEPLVDQSLSQVCDTGPLEVGPDDVEQPTDQIELEL